MSGSADANASADHHATPVCGCHAAKTRVEAGRATLQAVEGDVFTLAVSAYMDVIRDRAIVELNQNNVKVLETNLEATSDRFKIGDLTRTDVAQSEARLQLGRSQLANSQGRLAGSEAFGYQIGSNAAGALFPHFERGVISSCQLASLRG